MNSNDRMTANNGLERMWNLPGGTDKSDAHCLDSRCPSHD
jgi:hypothetical protein